MAESNLLQIFVLLQYGAFVADVPVVAAAAAEGLGLGADELCVHELREIMIGFAEIRQKHAVAVRFGVLRNRSASGAYLFFRYPASSRYSG